MIASTISPSSRALCAGPMVQLPRESVIIPAFATDKWVPRMKRGMTGLERVTA